jgi:hypothetical protein
MGQDLIIVNTDKKEYVKNKWDEHFNERNGIDYRLFHWFVITQCWFEDNVIVTDDEHSLFYKLTRDAQATWKDRTDGLFDEFKEYFG